MKALEEEEDGVIIPETDKKNEEVTSSYKKDPLNIIKIFIDK